MDTADATAFEPCDRAIVYVREEMDISMSGNFVILTRCEISRMCAAGFFGGSSAFDSDTIRPSAAPLSLSTRLRGHFVKARGRCVVACVFTLVERGVDDKTLQVAMRIYEGQTIN